MHHWSIALAIAYLASLLIVNEATMNWATGYVRRRRALSWDALHHPREVEWNVSMLPNLSI
jgi:hypothetical protein